MEVSEGEEDRGGRSIIVLINIVVAFPGVLNNTTSRRIRVIRPL